MTEYEKWLDIKEDFDLKKKAKELEQQRDLLLSYFVTISSYCAAHTKETLLTPPNSLDREIIDYSFLFNVHNFTIYAATNFKFFNQIDSNGEGSKEFIENWNNFLKEKLTPIFTERIEQLRKDHEEKNKKLKSAEVVDYIR